MSVEANHLMVGGPSGGGKTTYLRQQHAQPKTDISIFLTTKRNERKAKSNPPWRIRKSSCNYPEDIIESRQWALKRSETVQIIVDEAQNAPSFLEGEGPTADGLHEDRSSGVTWVVATQNPQDLHTSKRKYGPVQQCKYWIWVGPLKDWHRGFFQGNGMNDLIPHMPSENYEYVIINPKASLPTGEKIKKRGTTNRKYG